MSKWVLQYYASPLMCCPDKLQDSDRFTRTKLPLWVTVNVYNAYRHGLHRRESDHRLGTSTDKRTRWKRLRGGRNTSHSHIRQLCVEGTSCPSRTGCLDETIIMHHEKRRRLRSFHDDDLNSAFSPQYVDADMFRMTFKREVYGRVSNPEILNFDMLQERRQDRL